MSHRAVSNLRVSNTSSLRGSWILDLWRKQVVCVDGSEGKLIVAIPCEHVCPGADRLDMPSGPASMEHELFPCRTSKFLNEGAVLWPWMASTWSSARTGRGTARQCRGEECNLRFLYLQYSNPQFCNRLRDMEATWGENSITDVGEIYNKQKGYSSCQI